MPIPGRRKTHLAVPSSVDGTHPKPAARIGLRYHMLLNASFYAERLPGHSVFYVRTYVREMVNWTTVAVASWMSVSGAAGV